LGEGPLVSRDEIVCELQVDGEVPRHVDAEQVDKALERFRRVGLAHNTEQFWWASRGAVAAEEVVTA
jgi:hypothetical protein